MSRQEALNTFTDGLVMDLNPLTTPNNVLTDCLNGTIITYNDNEFILQNDQGNYKLKNAKLKENFIPVGIKEHANILYIVSYNPITKETEIGSYPSPQRIFKDEIDINQQDLNPIITTATTGEYTYEDLVKTANLAIYTDPSDIEKLFLNPGDLFKLNFPIEQVTSIYPYQGVKFYVLSENKELFPINLIDYLNEDFQHVFWETPGWIALKYSLGNMDTFNLNIKTLEIPEFYTADNFKLKSLILNAQVEVSDELFFSNNQVKSNLKNSDLKVRVEIKKISSTGTIANILSNVVFSNFTSVTHEDFTILYKDLDLNNYIKNTTFTDTDTIEVEVVPIITVNDLTVVYEQFRTKYSINLSSVSNTNSLNIAQNTFRYYVQESGLTLTFDIQGPFLNNSEVKVYYNIYQYNETGAVQPVYTEDQFIPDANLFGQNTISLDWITNKFEKENAYIISFIFRDSTQTLKRINKLLITSELFNDFRMNVKDYNTISGYDWISKYNSTLKIENPRIEQNGIIDYGNVNGAYINKFPEKQGSDEYTYIKKSSENANFEDVVYKISQNVKIPLKLNGTVNSLQGALWQNLNSKSMIDYVCNGEKIENLEVDLNSGTFEINDEFYYTESIGLFQETKGKELKLEHRKYFIEGMHQANKTGISTSIPENQLDTMVETIYDCPDNHWSLKANFRCYTNLNYTSCYNDNGVVVSNGSVKLGNNDVSNIFLPETKWSDTLSIYSRFMKMNQVPMLLVRMEGNDENKPNKWHGNVKWLNRTGMTATPNDNTGGKIYYVLMQSLSTTYLHDTNKSASGTQLNVMLLPILDKEHDPITFPSNLTTLIDKLNVIANAVYLVSKVDRSKWDIFTYETATSIDSHLELNISSICLKITFDAPTFHGKSMFKAESLKNIGDNFTTISNNIYNLEPNLIKTNLNVNNFILTYSNLPLITDPIYLNTPDIIKTNKSQEFVPTIFINDLVKARDLQEEESLKFKTMTDATVRKAGEFGYDSNKAGTLSLDQFVSQLTVSNNSSGEYTLGDVCLKAESVPRRVMFFRDDGDLFHDDEKGCFALEAFDTNYLP